MWRGRPTPECREHTNAESTRMHGVTVEERRFSAALNAKIEGL